MIKYICKKHGENGEKCNSSICPVCNERTQIECSEVYWCEECKVPIFNRICDSCWDNLHINEQKIHRLAADVRPVFLEERLLVETVLGKEFPKEASIWNGAGNSYYVNGKKIRFSISKLTDVDIDDITVRYQEKLKNTERIKYLNKEFEHMIECFIKANHIRYENMCKEALLYIKDMAAGYGAEQMFISFSGGKDSTVTADLVMRALGGNQVLHLFGDTTLEFPSTYEYIERYKELHPKIPFLSSKNKDKDFNELCKVLGPPSRVMRWCCTVFKTGAITRKIEQIYGNTSKILTFYGIRRSESASRSKYDRESDSPKITKQKTVSPIINWTDFDVWLYILTTGIDFNEAYRWGYARVGCWCCPNNSVWAEFLSKIHMREQSKNFRNMLIKFAEHIGKKDSEVYVDTGKWKARQGGNGLEYSNKSIVSFEPCATEENSFNYELQKPVSDELYELFKPFGTINKEIGNARLGEVYVLGTNGEMKLKLSGRIGSSTLKVTILDYHIAKARNLRTAEERVKCQLTKYQMCMGCMACVSVCRFNAIKIITNRENETYYKINENRCTKCAECVKHFQAGCYMRKVLSIKRK